MDLNKYPLDKETDEGVLVRLSEECSEVIKAICKLQRFGATQRNVSELWNETKDVEMCIEEFKRRYHERVK